MLPLNAARTLVSQNEPRQAVDLLLSSMQNSPEKQDIIHLSGRLQAWEQEKNQGKNDKPETGNQIISSLLYYITQLEIKEEGDSKRRKLRLEIERELVEVYDKLNSIDNPENQTAEALRALQRKHPKVYSHMVNLASAKSRLERIWKNPMLDFNLVGRLLEKEKLLAKRIEELALFLGGLPMESTSDAPLLAMMVRNNLDYVLKDEWKTRHRQACKRLLLDRIGALELKREKLLQAGALGLLTFSLGFAANGSVFGSGYDQDGFDEKGFDPDGFNRQGIDENGIDQFGYDHYGLPADMSPSQGIGNLFETDFSPSDLELNFQD